MTFTYRNFEELEAILPVGPDEQRRILIQKAEIEMKKEVRLEDLQRIQYYVTKVSFKIISTYRTYNKIVYYFCKF